MQQKFKYSILQQKFNRGRAEQLEKQSLLHCSASIKFELDSQSQDYKTDVIKSLDTLN